MKGKKVTLCILCAIGLMSCSSKQNTAEETVIQVKTMTVQSSAEAGTHTYVGTVEESYGSQLSFSQMGTVAEVLVDEGQAVRQRQALATLDKTTVQNTYNIAKSTLDQARDAYNRLNTLYKKGSLPEIKFIEIQTQLAQAEASEKIARKSISDCVLHAPFAGFISQRMVDIGNNVVPGMGCFKLVKIDRVKVKLSIPEKEIASVQKGQEIAFTVAALGGRSFAGKVTEKGVQANPLSHTYDVKLELANADHALLPGMVCSASLKTQGTSASIIIPQEAIMLDGSNTFVWIATGNTAKKCMVTTGEVSDQGVTITSGLQEGTQVIVGGQNKVSEGTKIKVS
jgi:membrane fusion protein (multidrug efflux system)